MKKNVKTFSNLSGKSLKDTITAISLVAGLAIGLSPMTALADIKIAEGSEKLDSDFYGTIIIDSSFTTLDCQNHYIYPDPNNVPEEDYICGEDDGRPATNCGVLVEAVSDVNIVNCKIHNFGGDGGDDVDKGEGIFIREGAEYINIFGNEFKGNRHGIRLSEVGDLGDWLEGAPPMSTIRSSWLSIVNNSFTEQYRNGITLFHAYDVSVHNNFFYSNGKDAMDSGWCELLRVTDNRAYFQEQVGFEFDYCQNILLTENAAIFNGLTPDDNKPGFSFDDSDGLRLTGNNSQYNKKNGFRLVRIDKGNSYTNLLKTGPITSEATENKVKNNGTEDPADELCDVFEKNVDANFNWLGPNTVGTICDEDGDL